ncbi:MULTISPECIES: hypothetical protein [unclassified Bradyrhizobium]|uniref:hypothetical protein n=1 Tax=unclassified Bradyrhizobium TaxID=2631580 RepID=UPI0024E195FA|nr:MULTISPECIES: hypothetical protein [unclassified Bradyrhizobium]
MSLAIGPVTIIIFFAGVGGRFGPSDYGKRRQKRYPNIVLTPGLNKTSTKPATYGERFVKRRGLFSVLLRPPVALFASCVSRKDHDRSAVSQLGQNRTRR